jgi:hypothetical protein
VASAARALSEIEISHAAFGCEVCVARRVDDLLVAEVVLDRPRVLPVVGQLVARRVPQHVRPGTAARLRRRRAPRSPPARS